LAITVQTAFVVAQFASILADISEVIVTGGSALLQPARALGHFVRAHLLQPVDTVG
jgi:hypothetical protein